MCFFLYSFYLRIIQPCEVQGKIFIKNIWKVNKLDKYFNMNVPNYYCINCSVLKATTFLLIKTSHSIYSVNLKWRPLSK